MCVDSLCPSSCLFVPTLLWQRVTENCFKLWLNPPAGSFEGAECVWGWFQPRIFSLALWLPGSWALQSELSISDTICGALGFGRDNPTCYCRSLSLGQNKTASGWNRRSFPAVKTDLWLRMFGSLPAGNHIIPSLLTYLVLSFSAQHTACFIVTSL